MKTAKKMKKRGRPALSPDEGKRTPLNMRSTKELRDKLEKAAHVSGRSLAQEVEYRLEKSFIEEEERRGFTGFLETLLKNDQTNDGSDIWPNIRNAISESDLPKFRLK